MAVRGLAGRVLEEMHLWCCSPAAAVTRPRGGSRVGVVVVVVVAAPRRRSADAPKRFIAVPRLGCSWRVQCSAWLMAVDEKTKTEGGGRSERGGEGVVVVELPLLEWPAARRWLPSTAIEGTTAPPVSG